MAEFIDFKLIHSRNKGTIPSDYGFKYIPLFNGKEIKEELLIEKTLWIEQNLKGEWSTWTFDTSKNSGKNKRIGRSYGFKQEEDLVAFKLRWI